MIGAGTIINPILKIVTTVAILGAAYIFIVKPVLDTTEDITGDVAEQTRQAQINANDGERGVRPQLREGPRRVVRHEPPHAVA